MRSRKYECILIILLFNIEHGHPLTHRHLHTTEKVRRRGFGKLLVQMWCKELLKVENIDPTAYVVAENSPAIQLFESLGFRIFRSGWFLKLDTHNSQQIKLY